MVTGSAAASTKAPFISALLQSCGPLPSHVPPSLPTEELSSRLPWETLPKGFAEAPAGQREQGQSTASCPLALEPCFPSRLWLCCLFRPAGMSGLGG